MNPKIDADHSQAVRTNKLDLIERLADDLAHEIKNPLHSMVINLEVLKRRLIRALPDQPEDLMRYVGVLSGELDRVNRRVELLLHLARPDRGGDSMSLGEVIEDHLELLELECERRGVELRFRTASFAGHAQIPRDPARQVILNVLLHGIDTAPPGSVLDVVAEQDPSEARLRLRSAGPEVEVEDLTAPRIAFARTMMEELGGRLEAGIESTETGNFRSALVLSLPLNRG